MQTPFFQNRIASYYHSSINTDDSYPALKGRLKTDTCIIGGGLSGLCTALPLAEQGHDVAVIEAARIGYGASGRSGGQVISDYACGIGEIERQLGLEQAQWFWQQSLDAVELVDERICKYHIECDWTRGYATVAIRPKHLDALVDWQQHAQQHYGVKHFELWDSNRLQQHLSSERYRGALYDPRSGHLHPLNYTLGIARAAAAAGARLYEHTPFVRLTPKGSNGYIVYTPQASIECKQVVFAMNTFTGLNRSRTVRPLTRKAMPVSTFIIATEPLGEAAHSLIRNNMAICDNRHILDYYRLSADGRLLFGGKDSELIHDARRMAKAVRRDMLKVFPQLEKARIDYAWGGDCDITLNLAPHFGRLNNRLYFMQGYSGHGMALTGIAGLAAAEAILGDSSRLNRFENLHHRNIIGGRYLHIPASVIGAAYYRIRDAR
ncbi:FAD-binding oxidoreductase [Uruburuella testudinis]|uniref:FAD-binding oxidoreductase n=1 Tax=Uruburuella testudinis TaxID=1282863 RepID=A0ABY4DUN3_9NEIS|nr:FAD-binding oxidoreductase [Uruburuella testudinis]UOO81327.1 FAD-binding oxidoreductase [Uruburuella testudinis]